MGGWVSEWVSEWVRADLNTNSGSEIFSQINFIPPPSGVDLWLLNLGTVQSCACFASTNHKLSTPHATTVRKIFSRDHVMHVNTVIMFNICVVLWLVGVKVGVSSWYRLQTLSEVFSTSMAWFLILKRHPGVFCYIWRYELRGLVCVLRVHVCWVMLHVCVGWGDVTWRRANF